MVLELCLRLLRLFDKDDVACFGTSAAFSFVASIPRCLRLYHLHRSTSSFDASVSFEELVCFKCRCHHFVLQFCSKALFSSQSTLAQGSKMNMLSSSNFMEHTRNSSLLLPLLS